MSEDASEPRTKFHISLNVRDLNAAVEFYRVLFGLEPAKHHHDYAKFEIEEPPVIFSLSPHSVACGGVMSNIGIQVADETVLAAMENRLTAAGIKSRMQTDALCGYARQVKLWVQDADENHWELYVPGEDVDPTVIERSVEGAAAKVEQQPITTWDHHLSQGPIEQIPFADAVLDEVRLQGTFNSALSDAQQLHLVQEAFRALRPGGKVVLHGLVADKSFPADQPSLPGLASLVARVPLEITPLTALRDVGFVGITMTKFSITPVFQHDGVEMREQKLVGWKAAECDEEKRQILYKGPFAEVADEEGNVFPRGQRATVPLATWNRLRESAAAEQFLFLQPHGSPLAAGSSGSCS
jgi:catechol 2,3-dioxygenase-like lactoylglutathione lyase family enzyme